MRWTVVIPIKALPRAKSRLLSASADDHAHRQLVEAIRQDTIAAARAADGVARILLVIDRQAEPETATEADTTVLVQVASGLNEALQEAAEHAATHWPGDGVAALVGDLPALRPIDLAAALEEAARHPRAHVPDAAGTGTTLLTARPGAELAPAFGADSSARHAAGAADALSAAPGLRADVDTAEELLAAAQLGVGPATASVLASRPSPGVQLKAG